MFIPENSLTNAYEFGLPRSRSDHMRVYPKVSGLAARSENLQMVSRLHLYAVISLFCESL